MDEKNAELRAAARQYADEKASAAKSYADDQDSCCQESVPLSKDYFETGFCHSQIISTTQPPYLSFSSGVRGDWRMENYAHPD